MIPYRVLQNLDTGHKVGDIVDGDAFVRLDRLVKVGGLSKALVPPLTELPGWTARSKKLATIGVKTVTGLLNMDPQVGTKLFRHKKASTFIRWVEEAKSWFLAPKPKAGCSGCSETI